MSGSHQSTRLGDLLVEKGKISRQQLFTAIRLQQVRRLAEGADGVEALAKTELGEILIELGFISRDQLKASLTWQKRLRKTTLVMTFVAPLLTAACGGGSGGGASEQPVQTTKTSSSLVTSTNVSSASSKSSKVVLSSSSASSRSSSSASSGPAIDGPVLLNWTPPTQRENGDYLDIAEVGGYQLRYKLKTQSQYTNVIIDNGYTDSYYFNNLKGDYIFEIAAYDKNGLYSDFVEVELN